LRVWDPTRKGTERETMTTSECEERVERLAPTIGEVRVPG